MNERVLAIMDLLHNDHRYHLDAYQFVREALAYAQKVMKMPATNDEGAEENKSRVIRGGAWETVLNSWGIFNTGDFGEIVYNLIRVKEMRKSKSDRREDFDNQYVFDEAFQPKFELSTDAG